MTFNGMKDSRSKRKIPLFLIATHPGISDTSGERLHGWGWGRGGPLVLIRANVAIREVAGG